MGTGNNLIYRCKALFLSGDISVLPTSLAMQSLVVALLGLVCCCLLIQSSRNIKPHCVSCPQSLSSHPKFFKKHRGYGNGCNLIYVCAKTNYSFNIECRRETLGRCIHATSICLVGNVLKWPGLPPSLDYS